MAEKKALLSRGRVTFLLVVTGAAVGVVAPIATGEMPTWSKPHLWLAWPILAVLVVALGFLMVVEDRRESSARRRGEDRIKVESVTPSQQQEKPPPPVAKPPQPYLAHPYPLQGNFTGRVRERQMLTEWLARDDRPVLGLVAIGGMGKSALTWAWLQRDVLGLPLPGLGEDQPEAAKACRLPDDARPEGVLWWSFHEGGGTFVGFLEAAIAYCSGGEKSAADYLTVPGPTGPSMDYAAMQTDIVQLAREHRFLFVWDGAERLLQEYGGVDASMREERDPEEMEADARDTLQIPVSRFLEQMCGQSSARLLVVSRLYPRVLDKLAGSKEERLTGLDKEDAVDYLLARGIRGNRPDLAAAAAQYEFHPLSLSNLAADLLEDFEEEANISAAPKYHEAENLKARRRHMLERAYDRRAPHRQELLSRLAAMRGTIRSEVVQLLAEDIRGIDLGSLGQDLTELVRHGLLRHPSLNRYDFHPVVRRYCYERLKRKRKIHLRLRDYFAAVPAPSEDEVQSIEELAPVIELYHHTVRAGRYDEAERLLRKRLHEPLYFRFCSYQTEIELLRGLFPDGESRAPRLKREDTQGWTLNALANSYALSGQPRRAVPLFEASTAMHERRGDKENLAVGLGNLAGMAQIHLGELAATEENLRKRIALCEEIRDELEMRDEFGDPVGHQELGRLLGYEGAFDEAAQELDASSQYGEVVGDKQGVAVGQAYRALRALLMDEAESALNAARRARELADDTARTRYPFERDFIRAEWLMGWALVAVASEGNGARSKALAEAERHLTEALARCRRINLVELEPGILLAWARWHRASDNAQQARADAVEALAIADRCEYRLVQADAHNFLAQMALGEGERKVAREHAEIAKERAWCDGPPHCYKPALDEAERLLEEAGSGA